MKSTANKSLTPFSDFANSLRCGPPNAIPLDSTRFDDDFAKIGIEPVYWRGKTNHWRLSAEGTVLVWALIPKHQFIWSNGSTRTEPACR